MTLGDTGIILEVERGKTTMFFEPQNYTNFRGLFCSDADAAVLLGSTPLRFDSSKAIIKRCPSPN